jgi:hypothetical protein
MDPSHASAHGAPVAPAQPPSDVSLQDAEIEPLSRSRERIVAHARWGWLIPALLLLAMIILAILFSGLRRQPAAVRSPANSAGTTPP